MTTRRRQTTTSSGSSAARRRSWRVWFGVAEPFHYIGPEPDIVEEYIRKNAVKRARSLTVGNLRLLPCHYSCPQVAPPEWNIVPKIVCSCYTAVEGGESMQPECLPLCWLAEGHPLIHSPRSAPNRPPSWRAIQAGRFRSLNPVNSGIFPSMCSFSSRASRCCSTARRLGVQRFSKPVRHSCPRR